MPVRTCNVSKNWHFALNDARQHEKTKPCIYLNESVYTEDKHARERMWSQWLRMQKT
jgi:hypothetical protein